jgi:hypothetical protein
MVRDFTLDAYGELLAAMQQRFNGAVGIFQWHAGRATAGCVIRHDVDRRPANAVRMAQLEHDRGVHTTYYFRVVGEAFDLRAMERVASLGHEVGYHYEDLSLARGDMALALESFGRHLQTLRKHLDVRTAAMHGSPLSRFNNLDMWKSATLEQFGLVAEAFLTVDYRRVPYFTDTGRDWSGHGANLRDRPPTAALPPPDIRTTAALAAHVRRSADHALAISAHPERWDNAVLPWMRQLAKDHLANGVKRGLRLVRRRGR